MDAPVPNSRPAVLLLRGRQRDALPACGCNPGGLRRQAYPIAIPRLVELGLVEERQIRAGVTAWFLTPAGRRVLNRIGRDERECRGPPARPCGQRGRCGHLLEPFTWAGIGIARPRMALPVGRGSVPAGVSDTLRIARMPR